MKNIAEIVKHTFLMARRHGYRSWLTMAGIILAAFVYSFSLTVKDTIVTSQYIDYLEFPDQAVLILEASEQNIGEYLDAYLDIPQTRTLHASQTITDFENRDEALSVDLRGVASDYLDFPLKSHGTDDALKHGTLLEGEPFKKTDSIQANHVAHLHEIHARWLFGENNPLGKTILIDDEPITILGVLEDSPDILRHFETRHEDDFSIPIYTPATVVENSFSDTPPSAHGILYFPDTAVPEFDAHNTMTRATLDVRIGDTEAQLSQIITILSIGVLFIALSIITIVMLFHIRSRYFEIAMRRAVGASKDDIRFQFIVEGMFNGLIGAILGVFAGQFAGFLFSLNSYRSTHVWTYTLEPYNLVIPFAVTSLFVAVTSLILAIIAASANIIESLRVE